MRYLPARFELEAALNSAVSFHSATSLTSKVNGLAECKIAVVCKAGRHRSVAVSEILHAVLKYLKFDSFLTHANSKNWPGCKGCCKSCCAPIDLKLVEDAAQMWPAFSD